MSGSTKSLLLKYAKKRTSKVVTATAIGLGAGAYVESGFGIAGGILGTSIAISATVRWELRVP